MHVTESKAVNSDFIQKNNVHHVFAILSIVKMSIPENGLLHYSDEVKIAKRQNDEIAKLVFTYEKILGIVLPLNQLHVGRGIWAKILMAI